MKTSYRLFSLFGIPIYLGWTVLFLPIVSTFFFFDPDLSPGWWIPALAFSIIIPISFAWHEFGHALMVRRFQKVVDFMELSVLGGTTRYREEDLSSRQLAWVHAMGLVHTFFILFLASVNDKKKTSTKANKKKLLRAAVPPWFCISPAKRPLRS